jgi:flagellar hook-length control protein FliK
LPISGVDMGSERNMLCRADASADTPALQANAGQGLSTAIALSTTTMQQIAEGVGSTNAMQTAPGKPGWDQAMSQKIVWMLGTGTQSAELTLSPPDLGPLQVVIQVNNDQASTQFMSDNPAVRQALEAGLEQLREKLSEAGVQLGQTSVSDGGRQQSGYGHTAQAASRNLGVERNAAAPQTTEEAAASRRTYGSNGLINTFA